MKPIYKSLALAAMTLQVSLALGAQTYDGETTSETALPAEVLDSLRVELVALNVSGARNLIESGECVIDGSNLTIILDTSEWTRGAMYRVQVLATFGTNTQVIYALNITVPYYVALSAGPQEFEDNVTIVSTITDVTESDLEGLALEETSQEIKAAITPISQAAEAYNVGKTQLAVAITSKGVETSPTETYPEMAEKVLDIQQRTVEITAPNWYGRQIGADGALWDLYAVLAQMKNQWLGADRYAALIVCEYYKGYDSLQLQGADAYYTCDGDFYDTSSPLHVWHDSDNGKANRWVCFLFATDGARLDITNTAISPRSMYIGGHIGTIEYFVNGRLTGIVCGIEDTDIVDNFLTSTYTQDWGNDMVIRGVKSMGDLGGCTLNSNGNIIIESESLIANYYLNIPYARYISFPKAKFISAGYGLFNNGIPNAVEFDMHSVEYVTNQGFPDRGLIWGTNNVSLQRIDARSMNNLGNSYLFGSNNTSSPNMIDVIVGAMEYDLNCKMWNPTNVLADATKKAQLIENIKNHILARVSDATGGTQLLFTVSTNMYNAIASEQIEWQGETTSLADAFLTKNWLLAGA